MFLAFFTPGISVLESAQRQQPAHHKCKERQAKKKKGLRLGQAQGTQAVQRQAGSGSRKAAFSCRKKTIRSEKDSQKEEKNVYLGIC